MQPVPASRAANHRSLGATAAVPGYSCMCVCRPRCVYGREHPALELGVFAPAQRCGRNGLSGVAVEIKPWQIAAARTVVVRAAVDRAACNGPARARCHRSAAWP
jgi:hypothetical protein